MTPILASAIGGHEDLLRSHRFALLELRPGSSAFVAIASALMPESAIGPVAGKLLGEVTMAILR